jgi:hypothetical protein
MGKWISVASEPGKAWYVDKAVDLNELGAHVAASETITLRLVSGGTLVIHPDQVAVIAFGED